jgi:hypothetical protein
VVIDSPISALYAKSIALLSVLLPVHIAEFPAHAPALQARLSLTIEAALQENPGCHRVWLSLCRSNDPISIELQMTGAFGVPGKGGTHWTAGGTGGGGAWPAGGGGGGGSGYVESGFGGSGADGAIAIFRWSNDGQVVDAEVLATPGSFTWTKPDGADFFKVILFGAGGGGGGGAVI